MADDAKLGSEEAKQVIEIWKIVVGVQMHFNDISMRIRSMFVTILLALFASIGFMLDKKLILPIFRYDVEYATLVPLFGIVGTYLFYFIDRHWYHRLLIGSVNQGVLIETKHKDQIPELALGNAIKDESSYTPGGTTSVLARLVVRHDKYLKTGKLHSDGKIELFYKSVVLALLVMTITIAAFGGIAPRKIAPSQHPRDTASTAATIPVPPAQTLLTPTTAGVLPSSAPPSSEASSDQKEVK